MTTARANWRAVCPTTPRSTAPSRKCTCQSSGWRMVIFSLGIAVPIGGAGACHKRLLARHSKRQNQGGDCGMANEERHDERRASAYWKANLKLLAALLTIWFACSFGAG